MKPSTGDVYRVEMDRPWYLMLWCALVGHDPYTRSEPHFSEWGCRRCGLRFMHQWGKH